MIRLKVTFFDGHDQMLEFNNKPRRYHIWMMDKALLGRPPSDIKRIDIIEGSVYEFIVDTNEMATSACNLEEITFSEGVFELYVLFLTKTSLREIELPLTLKKAYLPYFTKVTNLETVMEKNPNMEIKLDQPEEDINTGGAFFVI